MLERSLLGKLVAGASTTFLRGRWVLEVGIIWLSKERDTIMGMDSKRSKKSSGAGGQRRN